MIDKTSIVEHYVLHTCKDKGMGMEGWGRKGLGLISQISEVHHLENYASHKNAPIIHYRNCVNEFELFFNRSIGDLFRK